MRRSHLLYLSVTILGWMQIQNRLVAAELSTCEHISFQIEHLKANDDDLKFRMGLLKADIQNLQHQQSEQHHELKSLIEALSVQLQAQDHSELTVLADNIMLSQQLQKVAQQQESMAAEIGIIANVSNTLLAKHHASEENAQQMLKLSQQLQSQIPGIRAEQNASNALLKDFIAVSGKRLDEIQAGMRIWPQVDATLKDLQEQQKQQRDNQLKMTEANRELVRHLNETAAEPRICVRQDNNKLMCTQETNLTSCNRKDALHCVADQCHIRNELYGPGSFLVRCDHDSEGGRWIVIQRRMDGSVDFYRDWADYKNGFGELDGEFWLGLDKLHALTTSSSLAPMELIILLGDHNGTTRYAKYDNFIIGSEEEQYVLKDVGQYQGNAGDSFSIHKGRPFSTKDRDNDVGPGNCAVYYTGAWWYYDCFKSNLNGRYYKTGIVPDNEKGHGIMWNGIIKDTYSFKTVQMMIRPRLK